MRNNPNPTNLELDVLRIMAANPDSRRDELTELLGINKHTLHSRLVSLYRKSGTSTPLGLIAHYFKRRMIPIENVWYDEAYEPK